MTKSYHINELAISLILLATVKSSNCCYNFWCVSGSLLWSWRRYCRSSNHFRQFHKFNMIIGNFILLLLWYFKLMHKFIFITTFMNIIVRRRVQTICENINVIMTLTLLPPLLPLLTSWLAPSFFKITYSLTQPSQHNHHSQRLLKKKKLSKFSSFFDSTLTPNGLRPLPPLSS